MKRGQWYNHVHDWPMLFDIYLKSRNESVLISDTFKTIDYKKNKSNEPLLIMKERVLSFYSGIDQHRMSFTKQATEKAIANLTENGILQ